MDALTIGEFARSAGVNVETIRFYQRKGLLIEPPKPVGGIRRYSAADVARTRFIKSAQRVGFSLDEIQQLLELEDGTDCPNAAQIASARLADVRGRLAELTRIESALSQLLTACQADGGVVCCPLIVALHASAIHSQGEALSSLRSEV